MSSFKFENAMELSRTKETSLKGVLKGLDEYKIGILIAAPEVGKSHLVTSIAMECALNKEFIGISNIKVPIKVLVISVEDGRNVNALRLKKKFEHLSRHHRNLLTSNMFYLTELEPLCIPRNSSILEKENHALYLDNTIKAFSEFDLIIVDTVTEVVGMASTVDDELQIKLTFQRIAKESKSTILLVHHVTKDVMRDPSKMDMASATGITSLVKNTKLMLAVTDKKDKKQLVVLKGNNLEPKDRIPVDLDWDESGILMKKSLIEPLTKTKPTVKKIIPAKELGQPKVIVMDGSSPQVTETKDRRSQLS
ncbi:MAG: AAA family ATPase [Saccharospirillaceae bacterium]|nr:AAA family ATPase [Saccharospirillaceae bacterium]